ncbi:MAG: uroporphyrinogen decarboxylase [Candidatus Eisenbacteria bacterium]
MQSSMRSDSASGPNDLLLRTLRGQRVERRPVWIMRQAGRYLPEYRELRAQHTFEEMCGDPELAATATLQPIERFGLDGAIVFADLMSPVAALGIDVRFDPGPVVAEPIRTAQQVARLPEQDGVIGPEVMETLALVRQRLEGRATLLGFAGGPWSIAAYLVEGRGERGFPGLRRMAFEAPDVLEALLDRLTRLSAEYLVQQVEAGAQAVQLFETWSGILPAATWARLVKPRLAQVLERVGQTGAPRILFLQDATHLVDEALDLPADAFSLDWRVDLPGTRKKTDRILQGNVDPAALLAGPEVTRRVVRDFLQRMPAAGHVMNLGHGITPGAPLESVQALLEETRAEARASENLTAR